MRKILSLLTLAFLAAGCSKEIRIPTEDKDPVLVMNAQMDNLEETHRVNLSRSLLSKVEPFPGAQVQVYVNGSLVAEAVETAEEYAWNRTAYAFKATFKPGDEVRIEATKDAFNASATVLVPHAVAVASVDTSSVRMTYLDDTSDYLQLKVRFKDLPGDSWYGVDHRVSDLWEYLDEEGNVIPEYTAVSNSFGSIETGYDPVISEGSGKTSGSDFAALLSVENTYNCFSDSPIAGKECTLRVMAYPWDVYLNDFRYGLLVPEAMQDDPDPWSILVKLPVRVRRECFFRLRSLDFAQYHYLKALNNLETFGTEMSFLVEPTTLPCNVEGGLGFVSIETITEYPIARFEREYEPMDEIYY
jgi:hypothetical protein